MLCTILCQRPSLHPNSHPKLPPALDCLHRSAGGVYLNSLSGFEQGHTSTCTQSPQAVVCSSPYSFQRWQYPSTLPFPPQKPQYPFNLPSFLFSIPPTPSNTHKFNVSRN
ncbi:hypothetical protein EVAR_51358_1 [Eumeta japonica]|uniref:Uncharacterized protein n=1 Tax=Eumeta variegata TaxID=151549 RepID=A0A4C1Y6Q3_EUMVA|nr:hypothetical protein EVAR_51358_1 [Eumeta japonica]